MKARILIIALLAGLPLLVPSLALAQDGAHIQVTGSAEAEVLPDYINIHIAIEKRAKTKAAAKRQADVVTQSVLDILGDMEINEEDVDASKLFIAPEYRWDNNTRIHVGERATRTVEIRLHQLDKYTDLAERLVATDITRMDQRGFGFDDLHSHMDRVLVDALERARIRAELLAKSMGRELGALYQVSESTYMPTPMPRDGMRMMAAEAASADAAGAPLEIRAEKISATLSVVFLLD